MTQMVPNDRNQRLKFLREVYRRRNKSKNETTKMNHRRLEQEWMLLKKLQTKNELPLIEIPLVKKLIETGYTGRKGKGGFYRMKKTDSGKIMEAINLETGEYSTSQKIDIKNKKKLFKIIKKFQTEKEYSIVNKLIKILKQIVDSQNHK